MAIFIPNQGTVNTYVNNPSEQAKAGYGTYHMADNPEYYEPVRSNHFELSVVGLHKKLESMGDDYFVNRPAGELYKDADEAIRLACEGIDVPHFTQGSLQVTRGNTTVNYAGKPSFGTLTLKVHDFVGLATAEALMAWQNLSYNVDTEKIGLASDYKFPCTLREYTPDYITVREWIIYGCWISGISEDSRSSSEGLVGINATITYDKAVLTRNTNLGT